MSGSRVGSPEGLLSLEEFERLPEEGEYRLELVRGRVVREPRPGARHGWLAGRLHVAVDAHARKHELGLAIIETGFLLNDEPPTVRGPDVAFISASRVPPGDLSLGFWTRAPDLAVEVLSPSNSMADIDEKVREYLTSGGRLVWVVDPIRRSVTVYRSPDDIQLLKEGDVLDGGGVLPGFALSISRLFEPYGRE